MEGGLLDNKQSAIVGMHRTICGFYTSVLSLCDYDLEGRRRGVGANDNRQLPCLIGGMSQTEWENIRAEGRAGRPIRPGAAGADVA